jgi:hypothetical protein
MWVLGALALCVSVRVLDCAHSVLEQFGAACREVSRYICGLKSTCLCWLSCAGRATHGRCPFDAVVLPITTPQLDISEISEIQPALVKLKAVVKSVPRMERFIAQVCNFVFTRHPTLGNGGNRILRCMLRWCYSGGRSAKQLCILHSYPSYLTLLVVCCFGCRGVAGRHVVFVSIYLPVKWVGSTEFNSLAANWDR